MKPIYSLLFLMVLVSATVFANEPPVNTDSLVFVNQDSFKIETGFNFFDSEELLEIDLTFDIRGFLKTKNEPDRNFNANITVITPGKDSITQKIKLKARGKMRRAYCSFPPILLKFKDKKDEPSLFQTGNYKLVTHCSPSSVFENYILKEYLAYKLYNLVTPYSFKTRLVRVNYTDVNNPRTSYTEYGFLIESVEQLAQRNHSTVVENPNISQQNMDDEIMARVAFFNYMIGNTDWSVQEQHNVKVLKIKDPTVNVGIPVAYDFDYSGFVNSLYATPNKEIPITHVTERYFQGSCYSDEILKEVIYEFETLQPKFLEAIADFQYITKGQRKIAESYINGFFRKYRSDDVLIGAINRTCLRF